jgi:hypothetical protein
MAALPVPFNLCTLIMFYDVQECDWRTVWHTRLLASPRAGRDRTHSVCLWVRQRQSQPTQPLELWKGTAQRSNHTAIDWSRSSGSVLSPSFFRCVAWLRQQLIWYGRLRHALAKGKTASHDAATPPLTLHPYSRNCPFCFQHYKEKLFCWRDKFCVVKNSRLVILFGLRILSVITDPPNRNIYD